ncbi:MAG: FAD-dependent oxidoreductase [Coriobacteriales bacterium]
MYQERLTRAQGELLEAELFQSYGGWLLDSQFEKDMGSAYLLAHGMGVPVEDARTALEVGEPGSYAVWARAKDWVPGHHPGRFQLLIDGEPLPAELGANDADWEWQMAGVVELRAGEHSVALHDLTGFDGRCDAVFIAPLGTTPPESGLQVDRAWRKALLGLPEQPVDGGAYDLVIVGGGVPGCAAALAAARSGCRVALVQDRSVLGGNASSEVGLGPRGFKTPLVEQMIERRDDGSLGCEALVAAEPGITLFLDARVFSCQMDGDRIASVDARNLVTGEETRLYGRSFVDASGRGALGKLAGAEYRSGREARSEFNESLAPELPDTMHHGHTLLYHVGMAPQPVEFPEVPWATEVSKDFACLAGQMGELSQDNQPGPCAGEPATAEEAAELSELAQQKLMASVAEHHMFPPEEVIHLFPGTHYWEYGQWLDFDEPGNEELTRDHLMRALYGTMFNVKQAMPEKYANLRFEWLHHVAATGEYCRLMGDYILTENDVREHARFDDCAVMNGDPFCLHYPGDEDYDFRLAKWVYDMRDMQPYEVPWRCLYSRNVSNLMMAGKQISVSRVVGSSTKVMANGAQHGIAVGCAAAMMREDSALTPRSIGAEHIDELRSKIAAVQGECAEQAAIGAV